MKKKVIFTNQAPQAIGPYSQAIKVNNMLYVSGQIALDPKTMEIVSGEVEAQTHQVMKNLQAVLNEADFELTDVVKTTIYIDDMNDFNRINDVYAKYFDTHRPARATVEVSRLPKDVKVEIDLIAVK